MSRRLYVPLLVCVAACASALPDEVSDTETGDGNTRDIAPRDTGSSDETGGSDVASDSEDAATDSHNDTSDTESDTGVPEDMGTDDADATDGSTDLASADAVDDSEDLATTDTGADSNAADSTDRMDLPDTTDTTDLAADMPDTADTADTSLPPGGLIISEICDPNPFDARFIELYNGSDATINLGGWYIRVHFNGSGVAQLDLELNGSLSAGDTYLIGRQISDFTDTWGFAPDANSPNVDMNGNDTVVLANGDTVVDIFGIVGVDGEDEDWEYEDDSVRRRAGLNAPSDTMNFDDWELLSFSVNGCDPANR